MLEKPVGIITLEYRTLYFTTPAAPGNGFVKGDHHGRQCLVERTDRGAVRARCQQDHHRNHQGQPGRRHQHRARPFQRRLCHLSVQGWQLDQVVARIANVAANTFELEGIDATSYDTFTSGTANEVTFGTTLSSVSDINVSGGDFQMIDVTTIHDNVKKEIPGSASPVSISMTANWDRPTPASWR